MLLQAARLEREKQKQKQGQGQGQESGSGGAQQSAPLPAAGAVLAPRGGESPRLAVSIGASRGATTKKPMGLRAAVQLQQRSGKSPRKETAPKSEERR
jgi:hypothetical protein